MKQINETMQNLLDRACELFSDIKEAYIEGVLENPELAQKVTPVFEATARSMDACIGGIGTWMQALDDESLAEKEEPSNAGPDEPMDMEEDPAVGPTLLM